MAAVERKGKEDKEKEKNITASCDIFSRALLTNCGGDTDAEALSMHIQKTYGGRVLYSILANHYGACVSKNIRINTYQSSSECKILGSSDLPQSCSRDVVFHLVEMHMRVYRSTDAPGKYEGHASNLLVNHKEKSVTYFEPNGVTWWSDACQAPLKSWSDINFPGYQFVTPMEICSVGPQAIEAKGTCWLWSLLQFVAAVSCPTIPTKLLINNIIAKGRDYVKLIILQFACWVREMAQGFHLDVLVKFYDWFQEEGLPVLISTLPQKDVEKLNALVEEYYSRGNLPELTQYLKSAEAQPIVALMPPDLTRLLAQKYEPFRILTSSEYIKMHEEKRLSKELEKVRARELEQKKLLEETQRQAEELEKKLQEVKAQEKELEEKWGAEEEGEGGEEGETDGGWGEAGGEEEVS